MPIARALHGKLTIGVGLGRDAVDAFVEHATIPTNAPSSTALLHPLSTLAIVAQSRVEIAHEVGCSGTRVSAAARRMYERALAIREQVYGPDHPDTANIRSHFCQLTA